MTADGHSPGILEKMPTKSLETLAGEYRAVHDATLAFSPVRPPTNTYDYSALGLAYHPLKQRNHLAVLINRALKRPLISSHPIEIQINNIGFCNLRCPQCPTHGTDEVHAAYQSKSYTMTRAAIDKITAETFPFARKVATSGIGEGLLHKDYDTIVTNAGRYGLHVYTNSNGTTLIPKLVGRLFGVAELRLSLDGATPIAFEAVRLGAKYSSVMRNILVLVRTNERLPPNLRLRPTVNFGICASNVRDMPVMVDLCAFLGVDGLFGIRIIPTNPKYANDDFEKYPAYYKHYYLQAMQRARARNIVVGLPSPDPAVEPDPNAGPTDAGMMVTGLDDSYYSRLPEFERLIDVADLEPEIEEMMRAALEAGIARHSAGKPAAVREAVAEARHLESVIVADTQRALALLSPQELTQLQSMHKSEKTVADCFFLQAHLVYNGNGVVRGCCDPTIEPIGDSSSSANQLLASRTLMTIVDEFRTGQFRSQCRGCANRQETPERTIFPIALT